MESDKSNKGLLAWGASVIADQAKRGLVSLKNDATHGTTAAISREAIKDVRDTMHQVFFQQAEGVGEPGAPLNPLQSELASSRDDDGASVHGKGKSSPYGKDGVHGKPAKPDRLPSPAEVAREKQLYQPPPPGQGNGNGQENGKGRE